MAARMTVEELYLIDEKNNNKQYKIVINCEDAERARRDEAYAALLLKEAKKIWTTNEPSTSMDSINNSTCSNPESTEGTHIWSKNETLLLLSIYKEYKEEFHKGKTTVKQFWEKIAKLMKDKGYDVTGVKCSTKFQALKRTYKVIVDHNNKSGNNPRKWEYFEVMQELFAEKPWVQPLAIAGSHITDMEEEKVDESTKQCIRKRKLNAFVEQYMQENKEEQKKRMEIREKQHNERMIALQRIENLMKVVLEKRD